MTNTEKYRNKTCVSCPGKVLITGGYLVLDPGYSGTVAALSARFYTKVSNSIEKPPKSLPIRVQSPQFDDGIWDFEWTLNNQLVSKDSPKDRNPYLEAALKYTLMFIEEMKPGCFDTALDITILGDNDFYSQRVSLETEGLSLCTDSLKKLPKFSPLRCSINQVNKTGLGSSAAMMTSLVGALCVHFGISSLNDNHGLTIIHNLCQFCHSLAQGKIGSGFDVSSAVFGTHIYKRFSPSIISPLLSKAEKNNLYGQDLKNCILNRWDNDVQTFVLPHGIHLVLGEVNNGSSTPKMVSNVLEWKKQHPTESASLWELLNTLNLKLTKSLRELSLLHMKDSFIYNETLEKCSKLSAGKVLQIDKSPRSTFLQIRTILRDLSRLANVPIEPADQTQLLDASMEVPGVLLAGVPGAGGYDAVFCLIIGDSPRQNLEKCWSEFNGLRACSLLTQEAVEGIKYESNDDCV